MEEFLRYVVRQLVEFPEEARLSHREQDGKIIFELAVRQSDVGRLIGKGGVTISAVRELLRASALKQGKKGTLEVLE